MNPQADKEHKTVFSGFLLHLHPRQVCVETLRFSLSFGLGGMAATLVMLLVISGMLQLPAYTPDVGHAYDSVRAMYARGSFSGWIRNIHHWSGNALVLVVFLHLCRVFLTGAIREGSRKNWYIGLVLLTVVLFANFSGYLLPWDQLAYWAVTIFTSMLGYIPVVGEQGVTLLRGGAEVGQPTLSIFYSMHIGILPFCLAIFLVYHFWFVRKNGGLVRKQITGPEPPEFVPVKPHLLVREAAVGLSLAAFILLVAACVDAPLSDMANPSMSPNPAKAAWFFMGFQELLMHMHPVYAIFVLPGCMLMALLIFPCIPHAALTPGYWFDGKGGRKVAFFSCLASIAVTGSLIIIDEFNKGSVTAPADGLSRGALPFFLLFLLVAAAYFFLTRSCKLSRARVVMVFFLFIITAIVCLTCTGIWLRGPGMKLLIF